MKKVICILLACFIASCSNSSEEEITEIEIVEGLDLDTGKYKLSYYENSSLEVVKNNASEQWINIKQGEDLVFEYHFVYDDNPMISDDEYSETIRFEVPFDVTEFAYETEELTSLKTTLTRGCFCFFSSDPLYKFIAPTGEIEGNKLNENEWEITLDVLFYGEEKRTFTGVYKLAVLD